MYSIEGFNEDILNKIKTDLTNLRLLKLQQKFMFFIESEQKGAILKLICDPDAAVVKETGDYMKKYFSASKIPIQKPLSHANSSSASSVQSLTSVQPVVNDANVLTVDLATQPKLPVLFEFNKVLLNDFMKKIESSFKVQCIVDESVRKPSKANIKIINQQATDDWKTNVFNFIMKYFENFKQVRVIINNDIFGNLNKNNNNMACLKRLSRFAFEIIGFNDDVDRLLEQIKLLESNFQQQKKDEVSTEKI